MDEASPEHAATNAPTIVPGCHDKKREEEEERLSVKRERLTFSASTRKEPAPGESEFFEELERVLKPAGARQAARELTNWGGWWRNRYRAQPDKARRVLADIHSMLKEGRVRKNAGAAAVDLWARLPD